MSVQFDMLIDGKYVEGAKRLDVINPATAKVYQNIGRADADQLEQAVQAAKTAFPSWSAMAQGERAKCLLALADAIEARKDEFAAVLTSEQGKPLAQAMGEVLGTIGSMRAYSQMATPDKIIRDNDKERIVEHFTPLGVVAAITPWNFPLVIAAMKIAPALITGNTIVVKPAPTTPLTTLMIGECAQGILPDGVLNIIVDDNDLGGALSGHPDVAKVSFTGSTATGKKVMASGASSLKRLTLELGGNDAAIVLDDVDVEKIAPKIFGAATLNAGQVCLAVKRVYAPRSKYDQLCTALAKLADAAIVDEGTKQGAQIGPLQNKAQFEKVKGFIEDARKSGTIIAGGDVDMEAGYFIRPTIVRDIDDDARLVREEQFGPVLPILVYDDIEDVIARANDTDYGLGGSIWTGGLELGEALAKRVDSGTVWVNKHIDLPFDVPFGGAKQSGIGREKGQVGLEEFTQAKIVNISKL